MQENEIDVLTVYCGDHLPYINESNHHIVPLTLTYAICQ